VRKRKASVLEVFVVKTGQSLSRHSLNLPVRLKAQLSVDKVTILSRSKQNSALTAEIEVVKKSPKKLRWLCCGPR